MAQASSRRKKKIMFKRKRNLDPDTIIDYKEADLLKRFVTDRYKIIPRRISGASARQQREITRAIKRARYLALLPFTTEHKAEKKPEVEAVVAAATAAMRRPTTVDRPEDHSDNEMSE